MEIFLFFLIACDLVCYYYGDVNLAILAAVLTILSAYYRLLQRRLLGEISLLQEHERHRHDENGHLYYQRDGRTIHETNSCAACLASRCEELRREGYNVEHILGCRNSSDS